MLVLEGTEMLVAISIYGVMLLPMHQIILVNMVSLRTIVLILKKI